MGNACGGKLGSHGSKAILLSHTWGWSHHYSLSLPTCQLWQLNNREAGQMPDTGNYREGPHPGRPFKCLLHRSTEKDPRQGSPLSAWMGGATERLAKKAF